MKSTSDNTNIAKKFPKLSSVTRCKTEKWATFGIFCKILAIFVLWCKNISGNVLETGNGFFWQLQALLHVDFTKELSSNHMYYDFGMGRKKRTQHRLVWRPWNYSIIFLFTKTNLKSNVDYYFQHFDAMNFQHFSEML